MPRSNLESSSIQPDPRLSRALWQWMAIGVLCFVLFPAARGTGLWLGWLPFWMLIAPLASLAVLHRRVLAAAWRRVLVPAPRRRRNRGIGPQAQRFRVATQPHRAVPRAA